MAKKRIWNTVSCWLTSVPVKTNMHGLLLEPISKLKQDKEIIRNSHPDCLHSEMTGYGDEGTEVDVPLVRFLTLELSSGSQECMGWMIRPLGELKIGWAARPEV